MGVQGEIIRGVLSYSHPAGSIAQNVFTWELQDEDVSDAGILTAIEDWVDTEWDPIWSQSADSNVLLFLLEVDVLTTAGLVERNIGEAVLDDPGLIAGDVTAAATSGFFQMDTERAKTYGRKYTPGIAQGAVDEGILDAATLALLLQMLIVATTDIDAGVAGILAAGVLSRVTSTFQEATGSGYATDVPAYQRRRKPGVGS